MTALSFIFKRNYTQALLEFEQVDDWPVLILPALLCLAVPACMLSAPSQVFISICKFSFPASLLYGLLSNIQHVTIDAAASLLQMHCI